MPRRFFCLAVAALWLSSPAFAADNAAFSALLGQAQNGDPVAEEKLGILYYKGKDVPQDYGKAFAWAMEAAIQGNPIAEGDVGACYGNGWGVHRNEEKAFAWYLKASEDGLPGAQRAVGVRLASGEGTLPNIPQSIVWFQKAAIQGEEEAKERLGYDLLYGVGVKKDLEQGFAYVMSSSEGYPYSRYLLARCYADGIYVPRDPVRAYAWNLRAPQTEKLVQDLAAKLKVQMTADQIKQATDLSARISKERQTGDFQAEGATATLNNGTSATLKFQDTLGYIIVPLMLEHKKLVHFFVDTGASVSLLDSKVAAELKLTGKDFLPMTGIGAALDLFPIAEDVHFAGSGLTINGARMGIMSHFDLNEYLGRPIDGIIGTDILRHFVVRIDYAKKTLTLALPGHLPEDPHETCLPMQTARNAPFIHARVGGDASSAQEGLFLVDTGAGGTLSLTKTFQEYHPNLNIHEAVSSGAVGLGGMEYSGIGRGTIELGDRSFHEAIISSSRNKQGSWTGLNGGGIGSGIWGRFTMTLDFPGNKLLLKPNARFTHPFHFTYGGVAIKTTGGDYKTFVVYEVVPDSPGDSVGVKAGDLVLQIDKKPTRQMTMESLYDMLAKEGSHELKIRRDGADLTINLLVFDPFKHPEQIATYRSVAKVEAKQQRIESFSITGTPLYPDEVIVRATGLKPGDDYLSFTANRALKKLYATGLYRNVSVLGRDGKSGVKIIVDLQPNPLVKSIAFTGLSTEEEATIRPRLVTEEGQRTSTFELFQDGDLVRQLLGKANPVERKIAIHVTYDDGYNRIQEVLIPKSGA